MKRIIIILSLLIAMLPAQAQALRTCPTGYPIRIAHGCRSVGGNAVACESGYQGQFSRVNGRFVGKCVPGPIARGG